MSDAAGSGSTGQAGDPPGNTAAGNAPAPNAPAPGGAAAAPWYGAIEDADLKAWADNKNFKAPAEALKSYQNLERMLGADKAGRTAVIPADDDPTKWDEFYMKLGRPEAADKYDLKVPENADADAVKWFRDTAFKHGLSAKQANALFADYNAMTDGRGQQVMQQTAGQLEQQRAALKTEWGNAYDAKMAEAKQAAVKFGFTVDEINAIENQVGFDGVMKKFAAIGAALGDGPGFVGGDNRGGFNGSLTPSQAEATIGELRGDREFQAKLIGGDRHAQERWDKLHRDAYGKR